MSGSLTSSLGFLTARVNALRLRRFELSVTLDRPSGVYAPGETIHANIVFHSPADLRVHEARITLLRRERYERRDGHDMDDDESETSTSASLLCQVDEKEIAGQVVLRDARLPARTRRAYTFTASSPASAHPTWRGGKIVDLAWLVRATIHDGQGSTHMAQQELVVANAPIRLPGSGGEFGRATSDAVAKLGFALTGKEWLTGDAIDGHLIIQPQQDVDVSGVRVELERIELVTEGTDHTAREKWTARLADRTHLPAGPTVALPFTVAIPHPRPVSGRTARAAVFWLLRGVLESGGLLPDVCVEEDIYVYAGQKPS